RRLMMRRRTRMPSLNSSPRRSRRFMPAALGLAATVILAACSGDLPQPEAERAAAAPEPVLTQEQLDAVLDDVEVELTTGDASMNPDDLGSRIAGTAREIRSAEYLIEAADPARPITLLPREDSMVIVPASNRSEEHTSELQSRFD